MKVWVSTLVPVKGADSYTGNVRVAVLRSRVGALRDLVEWAKGESFVMEGDQDNDPDIPLSQMDEVTLEAVLDEELENSQILSWGVDQYDVHG